MVNPNPVSKSATIRARLLEVLERGRSRKATEDVRSTRKVGSVPPSIEAPSSTPPVVISTSSSTNSSAHDLSQISSTTTWTTPSSSPPSPSCCNFPQNADDEVNPCDIELPAPDYLEFLEAHKLAVAAAAKIVIPGYGLASEEDVAKVLRTRQREHMPMPCLQCVLKELPCDPGFPFCARCARAGHADLCLNQRQTWAGETVPDGELFRKSSYTLVRFYEDDETWARKRALESELLQHLRHRIDLRNWVYPDLCGKRGFMTDLELNTFLSLNLVGYLRGKTILTLAWRRGGHERKTHQIFT